MAKQIGILSLVGTIDGINFYLRNGKIVARKAGGGFNGDLIKKAPSMARVRENASEFGHCSRVKKVFKDALFPFFRKQTDGTLHGRMMRLFTAIKDCDTVSERGRRRVDLGLQTLEGKQLLTSFAFTSLASPILKGIYDTTTQSYHIESIYEGLQFPQGATHLELTFGVVLFDFTTLTASLCACPVLRVAQHEVLSNHTFAPTQLPEPNETMIAVVGYRYVQEVNGGFYALKGGNAFGLKVVGVG